MLNQRESAASTRSIGDPTCGGKVRGKGHTAHQRMRCPDGQSGNRPFRNRSVWLTNSTEVPAYRDEGSPTPDLHQKAAAIGTASLPTWPHTANRHTIPARHTPRGKSARGAEPVASKRIRCHRNSAGRESTQVRRNPAGVKGIVTINEYKPGCFAAGPIARNRGYCRLQGVRPRGTDQLHSPSKSCIYRHF